MSEMQDHKHLSFGYSYIGKKFTPILRFEDDALVYKDLREIPWEQVYAIRSYPDFYGDLTLSLLRSPKPRLSIYSSDGSVVTIRGDLIKKECETCISEKFTKGIPDDFFELVHELKERGIRRWTGPREESILFGVAQILFILGFAIVLFLTNFFTFGQDWSLRVGLGIAGGVVAGNLTFLLAPCVAKRMRQNFIAAHFLVNKQLSDKKT